MRKKCNTALLIGLLILAVAMSRTHADDSAALEDGRIDVYLQALAMTKDDKEINRVLRRQIALTDGRNTTRLMRLAQYAINNSMSDLAEDAYRKILAVNPGHLMAELNLGMLLYERQKPDLAFKYLQDYARRTGGDYQTNYILGEILYLRRDHTAAEAYFRQALKEASGLSGGIKTAAVVRAKALFRLNRQLEAADEFAHLQKRYPDDPWIIIDYAGFLLESGMEEAAYKQLQLFPNDPYRQGCLKEYRLDRKQTDDLVIKIVTMRISCLLAQRRFMEVKEMERQLQRRYPASAEAALSRASYYGAWENWRGQQVNLREALRLSPDNEVMRDEERRLSLEHGTSVSNRTGLRLSDNNGTEILNETKIEARVTSDVRLGVDTLIDYANLHAVPRRDGDESAFHGARTTTEYYMQGDLFNGDTARLSLFDTDGIPGVGGSYKLLDFWGSTQLKGAFRAPYSGQQQAIVERGTNTFAELERVYKPFESLTLTGNAGVNSYGLENDQNLAQSLTLKPRIEYEIPRTKVQDFLLGGGSRFTLNYELDFEKFYSFRSNQDGLRPYNPDDRQVHTFSAGISKEFTSYLRGGTHGGYAYDAWSDSSGPVYGGNMTYMVTEQFEISAMFDHVISSNKYFYAGLELKYYLTPYTLAELLKNQK